MKWTPKPNQIYYSIFTDGSIIRSKNMGLWTDEAYIKIGNCFRTKKQAEEKLKLFLKLLEETA